MTVSVLNVFKISNIDQLIPALILMILGYFGVKNLTQNLAVSLSDMKTLIKHYFLLFFLHELLMSF